MSTDSRLPSPFTRRQFLGVSAVAVAAAVVGAKAKTTSSGTPIKKVASIAGAGRCPIIGFSKPFQSMRPEVMADFVTQIGWDGIECPVRAGGQIEPARAGDELPGLVETFQKAGVGIHIVATDIVRLDRPHAETVLRASAKAGVKRIRLGFFKYDTVRSPIACLNELRPVLKDIAAACHELGLQAGFQNHSGRSLIGAPVWDVYSLLRELDPASIGMCFDIGHATIEGGLSWPIQARLVEGFYTAVFVKDFTWKRGAEVWKEEWCPLGQGMVSREFFTRLKQTGYQGPICQHHEYALGDVEQMKTSMRRDLEVLRTWLA